MARPAKQNTIDPPITDGSDDQLIDSTGDDTVTSTVNDTTGTAESTGYYEQPRKRRPRTPKTTSTPAGKKVAVNRKQLANQLAMVHAFAAKATGLEILNLHPTESEILAEGFGGVMDEYDLKPSPKTMAWAGLLSALASVYLPRIAIIKDQKKETPNVTV